MSQTHSQLCFLVREGPGRGTSLTIPLGLSVMGSGAEASIRLQATGIALRHLSVEVDSNGKTWVTPVEDAAITVNSVAVSTRTRLELGDRLSLGAFNLELSVHLLVDSPSPQVATNSLGTQGPAHATLAIGQLISERYRVVELLAAGGMGEVYRVEHVELGRTFALKVMRAELSASPDFVDRFRREAVASSRIGHPNIVDITDFGRTPEGAFFFVMEHLDGNTLGQLIEHEGAQPVQRVLHLARQLCGALGAAHAQGIVHRDLKPDNVMVIQRAGAVDMVKVLDFGIAKVDSGLMSGGQTGLGMLVGTPKYMSPEQAAGRPVDSRADIYSLGLIFYELLTGHPVFSADTPPLLMMHHLNTTPPPLPSRLHGKVPVRFERVIFSMLAKKPEDRPQTMAAVFDHLSEVGTPLLPASVQRPKSAVTARPPTPTRSSAATKLERNKTPAQTSSNGTAIALAAIREARRQRNTMALLGLSVVFVAAIGFVSMRNRTQPRVDRAPVVVAPVRAEPTPVAPTPAPPPPAPIPVEAVAVVVPPPVITPVDAGPKEQPPKPLLKAAPKKRPAKPDLKDAFDDELKELE